MKAMRLSYWPTRLLRWRAAPQYLFSTRPFHLPALRVTLTLQTLTFWYQSLDTDACSDKRKLTKARWNVAKLLINTRINAIDVSAATKSR